jgi:hypothetical protein
MLADKKYNVSVDRFHHKLESNQLMFRMQNCDIAVIDILNGDLEVVPNTEVSKVLYGSKKG